MAHGPSADDGAQAAQRRADAAGTNTERHRRWRQRPSDDEDEVPDGRPWSASTSARDGTAQARGQAARMHDNAASMHDEAVRLGIGDSDEHRRSAARHRQAATSHRPAEHPEDAAD